mmetsp:Transcript_127636/g.369506  ORF Transcript_127636/g.369506 Transcript_127636/m.369506 type:complete len:549 (-) Transcript_127636:195-1841(-)
MAIREERRVVGLGDDKPVVGAAEADRLAGGAREECRASPRRPVLHWVVHADAWLARRQAGRPMLVLLEAHRPWLCTAPGSGATLGRIRRAPHARRRGARHVRRVSVRVARKRDTRPRRLVLRRIVVMNPGHASRQASRPMRILLVASAPRVHAALGLQATGAMAHAAIIKQRVQHQIRRTRLRVFDHIRGRELRQLLTNALHRQPWLPRQDLSDKAGDVRRRHAGAAQSPPLGVRSHTRRPDGRPRCEDVDTRPIVAEARPGVARGGGAHGDGALHEGHGVPASVVVRVPRRNHDRDARCNSRVDRRHHGLDVPAAAEARGDDGRALAVADDPVHGRDDPRPVAGSAVAQHLDAVNLHPLGHAECLASDRARDMRAMAMDICGTREVVHFARAAGGVDSEVHRRVRATPEFLVREADASVEDIDVHVAAGTLPTVPRVQHHAPLVDTIETPRRRLLESRLRQFLSRLTNRPLRSVCGSWGIVQDHKAVLLNALDVRMLRDDHSERVERCAHHHRRHPALRRVANEDLRHPGRKRCDHDIDIGLNPSLG